MGCEASLDRLGPCYGSLCSSLIAHACEVATDMRGLQAKSSEARGPPPPVCCCRLWGLFAAMPFSRERDLQGLGLYCDWCSVGPLIGPLLRFCDTARHSSRRMIGGERVAAGAAAVCCGLDGQMGSCMPCATRQGKYICMVGLVEARKCDKLRFTARLSRSKIIQSIQTQIDH